MKNSLKLFKKIRRRAILFLIIIGLLIFFKNHIIKNKERNNIPFSIEDVRFLFPEAKYLIPVEGGLYKVVTEQKHLAGFVLYGPPDNSGIKGYAGEVPFLISLDMDYRIKIFYTLPNNETPGYSAKVYERLRDVWKGLKPEEAYKKPVDTVTGATMTSRALIEGVRKTLGEISKQTYDVYIPVKFSAFHLWIQLLTILFLIFSVVYFFLPYTSISMQFIINVLSLIIPGFLSASLLSLALFEGWIKGYFAFHVHWLLFIILLFAFSIPLITKRNFYCYNFCPFGSAQRLIGKIYKKKWHINRKVLLLLQSIRIILIILALLIIIVDINISLSLFEPFEIFRWNYTSWINRVLALFFLLLSFKIPNPWCRICPTGGIIEGIRRL
ncbi:MAG: 4Fe-4S binding protein [Candidatus Omnitrophica bacterium]|nr:4Fe-4S binding protein [Candidatus Omnitrophota bacterium]MCM8776670.1 4Fe-4S binding protein [Candidatus Omnitrophota bacterium]